MKIVKTKKGTELPLVNLKGKDYLMVAYRLQWLTEDIDSYTIDTNTKDKTSDSATVEAKISIYNEQGRLIKSAMARKTEEKKSFPDFEEKAETGAIGRALAMLGFGTQHAVADLDEGSRIVDAPVVNNRSDTDDKPRKSSFKPSTAPETKKADETPKEETKVAPKANGSGKTTSVEDNW